MVAVLRTLAWYARRPRLLPELWRQAGIALKGRSPYFREVAESYCEEHSVTVQEAFGLLGVSSKVKKIQLWLEEPVRLARRKTDPFQGKMGGGASMELLFGLARDGRAARILETGVAFGWSSLAILLATEGDRNARLVSVDMPYVKRNADDLVGLAVPDELRKRWTLIRRADREGIPQALEILGEVDLAHYDSDKTVEGRNFAYPLMWGALSPGGVLVSDDVSDNLAFINFCETIGLKPVIVRVEGKFAGIVRKPR